MFFKCSRVSASWLADLLRLLPFHILHWPSTNGSGCVSTNFPHRLLFFSHGIMNARDRCLWRTRKAGVTPNIFYLSAFCFRNLSSTSEAFACICPWILGHLYYHDLTHIPTQSHQVRFDPFSRFWVFGVGPGLDWTGMASSGGSTYLLRTSLPGRFRGFDRLCTWVVALALGVLEA